MFSFSCAVAALLFFPVVWTVADSFSFLLLPRSILKGSEPLVERKRRRRQEERGGEGRGRKERMVMLIQRKLEVEVLAGDGLG